jgi:uncharacterized membrane protein YphA (DoxX/SURF4 family)
MVRHRILAVLRILAGGGFLYSGLTKFADPGFLFGGLMHHIQDAGRAFPLYEEFLLRFVEFRQEQFAYLVAAGETLVGISLLLGAWVSMSTLAGAFLVLNFALATTWDNLPMMLAHLLLAVLLVLLGRCGAGLTWGLDRVLVDLLRERIVLFPWRPEIPVNPLRRVPQDPASARTQR